MTPDATPPDRTSGRWRIAFCITTLDSGGAENALVNLIRHIDRSQFDVRVDCLAEEGPLAEVLRRMGIEVRCYGRRRFRVVSSLPVLRRQWNDWKPDLIQGMLFMGNMAARIACPTRSARSPDRRPVVISGVRVADHRSRWRFVVERMTGKRVDHHICVSRGVADFLQRQLSLRDDEVSVIPNGVDPGRFRNATPLSRQELGLRESDFVILNVGRLDPQKAQDTLLTAFRTVAGSHSEVQLVIVGDGSDASSLRTLAEQLQIADRVVFAGRRDDLPSIYQMADLFVLSSRFEGMPNVVLEAMASGCPVVTTDVEGIAELNVDGDSMRVSPVGATDQLAVHMSEMVASPRIREAMASKAQHVVAERFTWSAVAETYTQMYKKILNKNFNCGIETSEKKSDCGNS